MLVAQDALYAVALAAVVVWLLAPRTGKVALAVQALAAVLAVGVLVKATGALHTDPRPFVVDPSVRPLFAHPADNGFPSDHTALAVAVAAVVAVHRRVVGAVLLVVALLIGASRVAAHVHHWQDIGAGVLVGLVAAALGVLAWTLVSHRLPPRLTGADHPDLLLADRGSGARDRPGTRSPGNKWR